MARKYIRIGSLIDVTGYDDGDFDSAIETDQPIKAGTPVDPTDVLRLSDIGVTVGDVFGPAASTDHAIVRFDGVTGKSLQDSVVILDDAGAITGLTGLAITGNSVLGLNSAVFQPTADSTTFFQILDADGGVPILNIDSTNERVGIGTATPACALEILSTVDPQLRLTHTDGVDECDFYVDSDGELFIKPTSKAMRLGAGEDGDAAFRFWGDTTTYTLHHVEDDGTLRLSADDVANYVQFGADGSPVFVGTAGLVFGSCYGNHIAWVQAAAAQNTWYNVSDADMNDGMLHSVTHDGDGLLTVTEPGMYLIQYSVCFEDTIANDHVEVGIEINGSGSANAAGQCHLENKFANEGEHAGSSCVLDLADNATIEVCIRTIDAGTPTITVTAVNIAVTQIGGT